MDLVQSLIWKHTFFFSVMQFCVIRTPTRLQHGDENKYLDKTCINAPDGDRDRLSNGQLSFLTVACTSGSRRLKYQRRCQAFRAAH